VPHRLYNAAIKLRRKGAIETTPLNIYTYIDGRVECFERRHSNPLAERETVQTSLLAVLKHLVRRPLGRARRRWVDNIKMDLGEIEWDGRDWIELAQDRDQWRVLVNTVMNLRVP
jgi:hypothetical protein